MGAIAKFFAPVLSFFVMMGMFTGLYNPCVEPFAPEAAAFPAYEGDTLTLISDGRSDYVIVVGAHAIPAEVTAAEKLRGFLEQIGGAALEIVTDDAGERAKEIVVGDTNRYTDFKALALGTDGFIIKTQGDKVIIAGGQTRGTLYGVYGFLERFLDCHWFSSKWVIIPERDAVEIPEEIDVQEAPAFPYRDPTIVVTFEMGPNGRNLPPGEGDIDFWLANRKSGVNQWDYSPVRAEEYGGVIDLTCPHSGEDIQPTSMQAEHPDYFAKQPDGVTIYGGYTNPCMSNPDVIKLWCDYAVSYMKANPAKQCVSMGLNDSGHVCQCQRCREIHAEEGCGAGSSGTYLRLLNAVCERLEAEGYPDVKVTGYAYACTEIPPTRTKAHKNVVIYFCPIGMCYAHTLEECTQEKTQETFNVLFKGWQEACGYLLIYEYPLNYDQYGIPNPIWKNVQSYLQYYHEGGSAYGLFTCTNSIHDVGFYQMTEYLYCRLLWDPYTDLDELYDTFLPRYYGDGWQYVKEYLRIATEELTGRTVGGVQYHTQCQGGSTQEGTLCMTNNEIKYVDALWANAKALTAAAGQEAQLENLKRAEISWRIWKSDNLRGEFALPFNLPGRRWESNKKLYADMRELGVIQHDQGSDYVKPEAFDELMLYILTPKYWSWRQIGRSYEGNIHSVFEMLIALLS